MDAERGRALRQEYPELASELARFLPEPGEDGLAALVSHIRRADADGLRGLVNGLRRDRRADPHRGRRDYARRLREVLDHGERALENGHADAVRDQLRRAVERVTDALTRMDDSSGVVGDGLAELVALYARACAAAPPPARRLAAWLVGMQLDGPGWPRIRLRDFSTTLGPAGLAECARLVEERRSIEDPGSWTAIWGVRDLREQLAELSGDVDAHVSVLAENLRSTSRFVTIVTVLRANSRPVEAERWARRGLAESAHPSDTEKLRDLLVDLLLQRGAIDDALAVRRSVFEQVPSPDHYQRLRETAVQIGTWTSLRAAALDHLRAKAHISHVISVLRAEGLAEEAWLLALASPGDVPASQWLTLIDERERDHPAEVIGPYRRLVDESLAGTGKAHYSQAVELLVRLRAAQRRTHDEAGFTAYLEELRLRHKRRPTLIDMLGHL
ncbi:DUF6880 family protein [Nonomuraea angiospora]|uniref:DUF6880 family protein n=1 Tax=Nonomuraea angiospora TaxID=46172 RepID=UPI003443C332